jgi:histidyl-tRNA synthetase
VNHRKLLTGLMEHLGVADGDIPEAIRILDKIDKIGVEKVKGEFAEAGYEKGLVDAMFDLTETTADPMKDLERLEGALEGGAGSGPAVEAVNDLVEIFGLLSEIGIPDDKVVFAPRLARGLAYYTGVVFETVVEEPKIGSIAGGGRYDTLIGLFSGVDVPATGMALGLERIIQIIQELGMMDKSMGAADVMVVPFGPDDVGASLKLARSLRGAGVTADVYTTEARMKKKLKYADRLGVDMVLIVAPDETARGVARLKDMDSGDEVEVGIDEVVKEVSARLDRSKSNR